MHNNIFLDVVTNKIFLVTLLSGLLAQSIKIGLVLFFKKKFNFKLILGTGGMPSAHAATVSALAISIGHVAGFDSPIFVATLIFAVITMFDAQGVRRAAGAQAAILNKMVEEIYFNRGFKPERLRELLGHTPVEVFVGALLGIAFAFWAFS